MWLSRPVAGYGAVAGAVVVAWTESETSARVAVAARVRGGVDVLVKQIAGRTSSSLTRAFYARALRETRWR